MRILVISQYFWPENFKINDLCIGLKERGHEVLVLTGKPNYPVGSFNKGYTFFNKSTENWNGIKIYRSNLITRGKGSGVRLFANYFSFAFFASLRVLFIKNKFDKIFVYQPSPVTVGFPGIVAKLKFKAPMFFWVQDLWPESITAAGGIKNKYVLRIMNVITMYIYNRSEKILVPSKSFIPYILNQRIDEKKLVYFPNSTESYYAPISREVNYNLNLPEGKKILFAGNIGESQSFDTLIDAALILKNKNIKVNWIIIGEGRMKEYVINRVKNLKLENYFHLLGQFPSTDMPKFFNCADALLVSLKKDPIFALTIPSKIQSYMASAKPIIACLDGEGSKIVEEANAGFTCPAEDANALSDLILKFYNLDDKERVKLGLNGRKYFEQEFERELLLTKLESILNSN